LFSCTFHLARRVFTPFILTAVILCSVVITYRLTIAFRDYLRVHLPFSTVLTSQVIAFLIAFLVLIQFVDFSRRV
jgi:hypothetical protein